MQENINHKIEDTLNSLDGIEGAFPKPFFFTRLDARMNNEKSIWGRFSSFVTRPAIAFSSICLIIMINAAVIFSSQKAVTGINGQNDETATVDEYSQVSSNIFELVNTQP